MIKAKQIILSAGALFTLPIGDIFRVAKKAGFGGIELMIDKNPETINIRFLNQLRKKYRIGIPVVHVPLSNCRVFGSSAEEILSRSITIARSVEARTLVVHPARDDNNNFTVELEGALLEQQIKFGMVTENLPKKPTRGRRLYAPLAIAKHYGAICLDTSHLATTGLDFRKSVLAVLDKVKHIHISDSNLTTIKGAVKDEHLPPAEGKLALKWLVKTLIDAGYKGYFCVELRSEIFAGKSDREITKILSRIYKTIKGYGA